mgnify:CR=1 FL=1
MYDGIINYGFLIFVVLGFYFYMYYKDKIANINSYIGLFKLKSTVDIVIENEEENIDSILQVIQKNMNASSNSLVTIIVLVFAYAIYLESNDFKYLVAPIIALYVVWKNHNLYSSRVQMLYNLINKKGI